MIFLLVSWAITSNLGNLGGDDHRFGRRENPASGSQI